MEITTEQLFSRRGVGYLWSRRNELDPGQEAIINSIYINKKKGSIEGRQTIKYKLSNAKPGKLGYGRLYGQKGSLETLEKECRGTICQDYYDDVDVVNCHPVLLVQYAKKVLNQDLVEVQKYVEHREEYLKRTELSRDDAKQEIIRIFYGGLTNNDFLKPLKTEVHRFTKRLSELTEHAELFKYCKTNNDNVYGSFLSHILQTEERHCMLAMKEAFENMKLNVDVLCYDGVMVRKDRSVPVNDDVLRAVEAHVLEKTGYEVKLVIKPFSSFEIPQEAEQICEGVSKQAYLEMKATFEQNHFYYIPTNEIAEVVDGEVHLYTIEHAIEYFKTKYYFKKSDKMGDYVQFLTIWRGDLERKMISKIDFQPSDDPNTYILPLNFNYTKYEHDEDNEEAVQLFEELLMINAGKDPILYDYFKKYLAHILQKPFDTPGVAIILTGKKGIGKDTLIDFFMEFVLGMKYSHNYEKIIQFFDKHDTDRKNKFMVKLEEADRSLCMANASTLKAYITSHVSTFNPKGKSCITTTNYNRFILTTNKPNPVEMTDGERRFVIMPVSPEKKGLFDYWVNLRTKLFTNKAGSAIANMLLKIDLSSYNPRILPKNEYQENVVLSEKASEEIFFESGAWDGAELDTKQLFQMYKNYCTEQDLPFVPSVLSFGRKLIKYMKPGECVQLTKRKVTDGYLYSVV